MGSRGQPVSDWLKMSSGPAHRAATTPVTGLKCHGGHKAGTDMVRSAWAYTLVDDAQLHSASVWKQERSMEWVEVNASTLRHSKAQRRCSWRRIRWLQRICGMLLLSPTFATSGILCCIERGRQLKEDSLRHDRALRSCRLLMDNAFRCGVQAPHLSKASLRTFCLVRSEVHTDHVFCMFLCTTASRGNLSTITPTER